MQKWLLAACLGIVSFLPTIASAQQSADSLTDAIQAFDSLDQADQKQMEKFARQLDANGDGKLDGTERLAIQSALDKLQGNPEKAKQLLKKMEQGRDDQRKDGQKPPSESPMKSLLKQYDADGDGKLGTQEIAAMKDNHGEKEAGKKRPDGKHEQGQGADKVDPKKKPSNRADRNHDGQVGPREKAAAKKRLEQSSGGKKPEGQKAGKLRMPGDKPEHDSKSGLSIKPGDSARKNPSHGQQKPGSDASTPKRRKDHSSDKPNLGSKTKESKKGSDTAKKDPSKRSGGNPKSGSQTASFAGRSPVKHPGGAILPSGSSGGKSSGGKPGGKPGGKHH
jgi:23S rRNA pseudouridine2605 synthase